MPMDGQVAFRKRLRQAVDAVFDGNVTAAAAGLGVSQPTLHKILSGKTRESKSSTIAHLADHLGVPESWLRGGSEPLVDTTGDPVAALLPDRVFLVSKYYHRQARDYETWIQSIGVPQT